MRKLKCLFKNYSLLIAIVCLSAAEGWGQVHRDSTPICGTVLRYSFDEDRVILDFYKFNKLVELTDQLCLSNDLLKKQNEYYKDVINECDSLIEKLNISLSNSQTYIDELSSSIEDSNKNYNDLQLELEYLLKDNKRARRRSFWKGVYVGGGVVIVGSTAALLMVILN